MPTTLRAEAEPISSRLDYWRGLICDTFVPFDLRVDAGADFRGRLLSGQVGAVRVSAVTGPPGEVARTPALIRRADPGLCKVDVLVRGRGVFAQHDRQAEPRPGDLTFVDLSQPCRWAFPGDAYHRLVGVSFPWAALPLPEGAAAGLAGVRIPGDQGTGALVSALVVQLVRHLDDYGAAGARVSTALLDLLAVTLQERLSGGATTPADTTRRALLLRIRAFIDQQLPDPALAPSSIAAAHHISTRYLNKLFHNEGTTVTEWVRRRRLDRCRRDLLDPALATRPVGATAARWGFTDPAHFSRVFRAAYGMPPAEYRRTHNRPRDVPV